jgi:hypothetical protein
LLFQRVDTKSGAIVVTKYSPKDKAVAASSLAQYQALKQKLINEWGIGASVMKKYDIEPYLKQQEAYENLLVDFGDMRKQYNELSDELRTAQSEGSPDTAPLQQKWIDVGGKIQTMGSKQLLDVGAKFAKNLSDFESKLEKLVVNLQKVETKTPKQRADLVALLQFLKKTLGSVKNLSNEDFDFVQAAVDAVKAKAPIT